MKSTNNIITGEKLQELSDVSISKLEHKKFESNNTSINLDVDNYDFGNFDNDELIYINSSLLNLHKPRLIESKIYDKLKQFKNPFRLILHNSDQSFDNEHLVLLDILNCKKIYTQNMNVVHPNVIPLPIGIANSIWKWGNLDSLVSVLKTDLENKTKNIFVNFTADGGERDIHRTPCKIAMDKYNISFQENTSFDKYLSNLSNFKYSVCPAGNGLDTYRMWESLYLKVIPICVKNPLVDFYSKIFPIVVLDSWDDFDETNMNANCGWENYNLLKFDNMVKYLEI
jgi:hypothetical protein